MSKYDLGIVDFQYILRRNWSIMRNNGPVDKNLLIKSALQSIMKLKREMDFARPLLLLDKYPYYKQQEAVEEYKQDRHYVSESDTDLIKKKLEDPNLSDDERADLEEQLRGLERELADNKALTEAKYDLVFSGRDIGFPCLIKQGFEADDIAMALAEKVRQLKLKAVLITTDRDWVTFRSREVDYMTPKQDHRNQMCREYVLLSRKLDIPMYELGVMREIYDSSHNNVQGYDFSSKVDFETFAKKLFLQEPDLPGYEKVLKVYQAMNMRKHFPELEKMIYLSLSPIDLNIQKWYDYLNEHKISLPLNKYTEYTSTVQKGYI